MLTRGVRVCSVMAAMMLGGACGGDPAELEDAEDDLLLTELTGSSSFQSVALPPRSAGTFVVECDARPLSRPMDGVIGLGSAPASSFSQLATTVRFNNQGRIDARSGSTYAPSTVTYTAGVTYRVRMTVNMTSRTYDVTVTPAGGAAMTVGAGLAFRTEQSSVAELAALSLWAGTGRHDVTNVSSYYPTPSTPTGLVATAASSSQIDLRWNAATGINGVTTYRLYRGGNFVKTAAATTTTDSGLTAGTTYGYQVAAVDPYGTPSFLSAAATATTPGGAWTSSPTFQTMALPPRTSGTFTVELDAVPNAAIVDAVTGVVSGSASGLTQLAAIVRFNNLGRIDVRNGSTYAAASSLSYAAGQRYHVKMTLRLASHTYDVTVTPAGGVPVILATGYAFRSEQSAVSRLDGLAIWAAAGTHTVANVTSAVVETPDPGPSDPGTGTTSALDPADILSQAQAGVPFASQSGFTAQVIGTYTSASSIPESGIHGTRLSNGETLRLGKVANPVDTLKKALFFQLAPTDPSTSGSKRCELSFPQNVEMNKVYWVALSVYVYDWGTLSTSDVSLFGTQMHSGDNSRGLSPSFSVVVRSAGRNFQIMSNSSTSSSPSQSTTLSVRHPEQPIPFGRWADFVFKFKQNTAGSGFLQVWVDGTQLVNYTGNLGFNTPGFKDYAKFGYYNWSSGFNSSRKVLLRSPVLVADPTGSKYAAADLRAFVTAR
jgi:hypothetical protein